MSETAFIVQGKSTPSESNNASSVPTQPSHKKLLKDSPIQTSAIATKVSKEALGCAVRQLVRLTIRFDAEVDCCWA